MASAVSASDLVAAVRRNSEAIMRAWARLLGSARARIAADLAGGAPDAWLSSVVALLERPGQAATAHRAMVRRASAAGFSGTEIAHAYASLGEALVHTLLRDRGIPQERRADLVTLALRVFEQGQKWLYEEWAGRAAPGARPTVDCREIVDLTTDVVIALDAEKRVTLANPALTSLTGLSAGEVIGHSVEALVSPRSAARLAEFWETHDHLDAPPLSCELELRAKGTPALIPIDASCIPIPNAEHVGGTLIIGRDVRQRKQAEMQLQRQNRFLAAINAITEAIGGSLELDTTLHAALAEVVSRLRADSATIHLLSPEEDELRLAVHAALSDELAAALAHVPASEGLLAQAVRGDAVLVAERGAGRPKVFAPATDEEPGATTVLIPLIARAQTLGVLAIVYKRAQPLDEADRRLLSVIGRQIGTATDNATLYDHARRAAMCDSLTGLYDHGELWRRLEAETERSRRYGRKLSFLYLDMDNLKAINDTHGHIMGDSVLKGIAQILSDSVRAGDTAARYGGDEFAVILPETSLSDAAAAAERIRKTVAETTFRAPGVESAARATLCVGVAMWSAEMQDAAGLVHCADLAQYQAKARGGNAVGIFENQRTSGGPHEHPGESTGESVGGPPIMGLPPAPPERHPPSSLDL